MRFALLATTILGLAASTGAQAQDRTPDQALDHAAMWTGAYVGGQFGLTVGDSNFDVDNAGGGPFFDEDIDDVVINGGLYVGYMQQFGSLLLGVEGDISGMPFEHENLDVFFNGKTSFDYSAEWLSTVRGRVGVTHDSVALYATGGLAFGEIEVNFSDRFAGVTDTGSSSEIEWGWTAGGGAALALDQHWFAKAEYLYVDLEDTELTTPVFLESVDVDNIFHLGRVGLGYRF